MALQKVYTRINWENAPSEDTPLNETNLNKIDYATDAIDDRVITLDTTKLSTTVANTMVQSITFDDETGIFTITKLNGSATTIDTGLEKIAVNFTYDAENERLVITLDDGTVQYVDMSALITEYDFSESSTITFTVSSGVVTANIKNGSVTDDMIEANYLANITIQATTATQAATTATSKATLAQSYAVGGTGTREGEDTDNARYYKEQAQAIVGVDIATTSVAGLVKASDDVNVASDGTMSVPNLDGLLESIPYALAVEGYTQIPDNVDLDDYVTPGTYATAGYSATTNITNSPVGTNPFKLTIEKTFYVSGNSDYYIRQILKPYNDNGVYVRIYNSSSWSAWGSYSLVGHTHDYLPLDGTAAKATSDADGNVITETYLPTYGGTVTGALNFTATNTNASILPYAGVLYLRNKQDTTNNYYTDLKVENGKVNVSVKSSTGTTTSEVLHTGNSKKVVVSDTAPSDTTALWVY